MHLDPWWRPMPLAEKDLQIFPGSANQAAAAIPTRCWRARYRAGSEDPRPIQRLLSPNWSTGGIRQAAAGNGGALSEVTLCSRTSVFHRHERESQPRKSCRCSTSISADGGRHLSITRETPGQVRGRRRLIALFGAPVAIPNAEKKAVEWPLDMMQVLSEFNRTRASEGQEQIRIGIGINTGTVVTGAIGSSRALQYTAIGRRREHGLAPVQRGQARRGCWCLRRPWQGRELWCPANRACHQSREGKGRGSARVEHHPAACACWPGRIGPSLF